jgi:type II secretory pathway pseudopilin PulG
MAGCAYPPRLLAARNTRALTLIELIIVIGVIIALMAISFPVVGSIKARSDRDATQALIAGLVAAAATYRDLQVVPVTVGSDRVLRRPWDVDQDGIIDGDSTSGWIPTGCTAPAWYRGPALTLGLTPPKWALDGQGRLQDRWRHPLHVRWDAATAGPAGFAVWSLGKDGIDQTHPTLDEAGDDIRSWDQR